MYRIKEMAELSGVTTRTLRYYDQIDLLKPSYTDDNGYRYYSKKSVDKLQLILFYKEIGYTLGEINISLHSDNFNNINTLLSIKEGVIKSIVQKQEILSLLNRTINARKAGKSMNDINKFEAFKNEQLDENNRKYGNELRKYDTEFVQQSYKKYQDRTKKELDEHEVFTQKMHEIMKKALATNDPKSVLSQKMCKMHKIWIMFYWPKYSSEAHLSLVQMYKEDNRFRKHYEKIATGLTDFLYNALKIYLN